MTSIRTAAQLTCFALLTFLMLDSAALFRHSTLLVLLPLIPLALVFVVAPSVMALRRESVSLFASFTWWQGLWVLFFLSGLVFRMRAAQDIDQSPLDIWAAYRVGLVLIIGLILFARLVFHRTNWLGTLFSGTIAFLAVYSLISVISTVWSVRPSWTLYKSIEYLIDLALISAIVVTVRSVQDYRKLVNWTWTLLGLLVASAWVGAIIDPADGLLSGTNIGPLTVRLEGVMPSVDANTIGEICAILALVSLHRILDDPEAKSSRAWYGGLLSASLVTLIFSQTRAAIVAFVVGLIVLLLVTRRFVLTGILAALSTMGAMIVLTFTNFGGTLADFLNRGQTTQSVRGLSGRVDVWQASFEAFARRPWIGYGGFAGSRFVILPYIPSQAAASSALSTYFDSLLDLGVWGPLIIMVALVSAGWFLFQTTRNRHIDPLDRPLAVEMLVVLAVIIVRSFVTANIVGHPALQFLTVIGFIEVVRRHQVAESRLHSLARSS
jgi:O-antigen ligase